MHDDHHFYEPAQGHGLPHAPFNAIVGPCPIGWIATRSAAGALTLAPYSFLNGFNYHPPIIGFSSIGRKDTLRNIEETGEFVWNLATRPLAQAMNASSAPARPGVDEIALAVDAVRQSRDGRAALRESRDGTRRPSKKPRRCAASAQPFQVRLRPVSAWIQPPRGPSR